MGYSTKIIQKPIKEIAELVSTNDPAIAEYLGRKIRVITVGREYIPAVVIWKLGDNGYMFAEYSNYFAEFAL